VRKEIISFVAVRNITLYAMGHAKLILNHAMEPARRGRFCVPMVLEEKKGVTMQNTPGLVMETVRIFVINARELVLQEENPVLMMDAVYLKVVMRNQFGAMLNMNMTTTTTMTITSNWESCLI